MAPRAELRLVDPSSTFADLPDVMTVEEAARVLRIGRGAAYALARQYLATDGREACPWCAWGAACGYPGPGCSACSTLPVRRGEPAAAERRSMDQGQGRRATTLLLTATARTSCRAVGTTAWAVLADLALDAEVDAKGRLVAETNVRRIAAHLAISKDCAARALLRLDGAGLVVRLRPRRGTCGRFAPSGYELRLGPDAGVALLRSSPATGSPSPVPSDRAALPSHARRIVERADAPGPRPRRAQRKAGVEQRPLFDPAGESSGLR